jgi:hypothetical protein
MSTAPATASTPQQANGASPQVKQPSEGRSEFPDRLALNITPAMTASLERMRRHMRLKVAVVARLGLMEYLARHDPQYREVD